MTSSAHLRGIVIAGALAALALALAFVTLAMNQTAAKTPHTVIPLKDRHQAAGQATATTKVKPVKRPDPNLVAALQAGLPRPVALALAAHKVVVVEVMSQRDAVAKLAAGEAKAGAKLANVGYVVVNVDKDGGPASKLTVALGELPSAPASLIYIRPGTLAVTLPGFNDRTVVQQAAMTAPTAPIGKATTTPTTQGTPTVTTATGSD